MNVSDRRGNPVRTYASEPPRSGIHAFEDPAEAVGAARELEASLDIGPPAPAEVLAPVRPPREQLERAGERLGIAGRNEDAGAPRQDGVPDGPDVARHHGAGARQRLEHD